MKVASIGVSQSYNINKYATKPAFSAKEENVDENKMDKKKVCGLMAAAAVSAAIIGGAIAEHRVSGTMRRLRSAADSAQRELSGLTDNLSTKTKENEALQKELQIAKKSAQENNEKFLDLFEGDINPKEAREGLINKLKQEVDESSLDYNYMEVPATTKVQNAERDLTDAIMLPENVSTINRINMQEITTPQFHMGEDLHFELPMTNEVKITKESKDFKPVAQKATEVSADYADDISWNSDKIARDLMQNFYDGHGQTLDGVKMSFVKGQNGKYKVRIEGKTTFSPAKAILIGKSSKRDNAKAAGHYGEGLKISVLKLLKDYGTENVQIASDNWKTTWKFMTSEVEDEKVLSYSLDKTEKLDGNYIEFETKDEGLLQSLCKSVNRFYHSGNNDFKCPDFENDLMGIKILNPNEKGSIYIAGQKFEVDNDYEGLKGLSIFIKEKPPEKMEYFGGEKTVFDQSRDRISLNADNLGTLGEWLAKDSRLSNDDLAKIIKSMERYWSIHVKENNKNEVALLENLVNYSSYYPKGLKIKFPDNYLAYSNASEELVYDLENKGYKICKGDFARLGMPTIKDVIGNSRDHKPLELNDIEKKKIVIIKKALEKLSPRLMAEHFTPEELNTKIYMFNRNAENESKITNDALAEAIIDGGKSKGFWIDKNYLDTSSFANILGTTLHEMSHKVGGDESSVFSYKLTDVLKDVIDEFTNSPQTRTYMNSLQNVWNDLGVNTEKVA
ncbi:MAG: hypothetical protein LKG27_04520 [Clostridiaceae bacterium]|nr:hypothetical protein [Clostridiaceae bacterium]